LIAPAFSVAAAVGGNESTLSCHKSPRLWRHFGRERGKKSTTVTLLQQRDGLRGKAAFSCLQFWQAACLFANNR
jgi:hypothetical protein